MERYVVDLLTYFAHKSVDSNQKRPALLFANLRALGLLFHHIVTSSTLHKIKKGLRQIPYFIEVSLPPCWHLGSHTRVIALEGEWLFCINESTRSLHVLQDHASLQSTFHHVGHGGGKAEGKWIIFVRAPYFAHIGGRLFCNTRSKWPI